MTQILYGNTIAKERKELLRKHVDELVAQNKRVPHLSVVLVGDDPASKTYVSSKAKQCAEVGFESSVHIYDASIPQEELIAVIDRLNKDMSIDGILVQLPLPKHLNEQEIIERLDPTKDVDGLHPVNVGYLELNTPRFIPCTPKGIMTLLEAYNIEVSGKRALVIGRSRLVGKPIASLLLSKNATVTMAHSKTVDMQALIKEHDLVVVAIGKQTFFTDMDFTENQVVIDVGIHRSEEGLVGDVDRSVYNKVRAITPVPKGVGPMTILSLLENTLIAYQMKEHTV